MFIYSLTLQKATAICKAVYGNFSAPKAQEIVVSRGKILELLRPDDNGKLQVIVSTEVFGVIRDVRGFRLTGANKDYIVVGSDSGKIVILSYNAEKNVFEKVHQETYGKSGCRRITPGQYLGVDPAGRAVMVGACEKQKHVYVLNRDNAANLTISSPLEAHKSHTIVFDLIGVDCGYDNPIFAAIELDYADADQDSTGEAAAEAQKHLTFYELDLGLNHVVRKWTEPVDNGANMLVAVPGGGSGPGGVLVCAENFIIYKNQGHEDVRAVIPRRGDLPAERGVLLVSHAAHRQKSMFFFLVQSEYGDLYKVSLEYEGEAVSEVKVAYFDTIPPCTSICVLKTGFLFAASEAGDHALYQFVALGDDGTDVESSSATLMETEEGFQPVFFSPRPLKNLAPLDEPESLAPITDMKAANLLGEETPQIFALCGRGARSSLRVLRPGLAVTEMAVSELPGNPSAVWTVRRSASDEFDSYIVVSFVNATLVLSVGETVEEVSDSGFLGTTPSLAVALLEDSSMLQVHPTGLRHIRADRRINEWKTPGRKQVQQVACNAAQVVIALSGGEVVYFELDRATGQLMEVEKKDTGGDVACLDVAPVPEGRQRSRFLAVGGFDSTVRLLSLDPEDCMQALAVQQVAAAPSSLLLVEMGLGTSTTDEGGSVFLNIALANGVLLRTEVDRVTGALSDTRTRFLGARASKLFHVRVRGRRAMLALSSRPWLAYVDQGRHTLSPLSYEPLEHACAFSSEQCPDGIVAVAAKTLRILSLERLGEAFNQTSVKLRYTPRKFVVHPQHKTLLICEADHGTVPYNERAPITAGGEGGEGGDGAAMDTGDDDGAAAAGGEGAGGGAMDEETRAALGQQFGAPVGVAGQWGSCLRVVDPASMETTFVLELDGNEAALSLAVVSFADKGEGLMLAVGTVKGLTFNPRASDGGFIHLYRIAEDGRSLSLLHKTPVDGVPGALCAFQGRLLAGVGGCLRMYELGKRKLLRKCENKNFPTYIQSITCVGDRIYVGDLQESFHYVKYKRSDNAMYVFADDFNPRYLTSALNMDYDTMCGGDKFGNVFFARLAADVSEEVEDDPTGGKHSLAQGTLNGAPNKVDEVIQFHVGETVTALQRAVMQPGGGEVVLYGTVMGGVGALLPFTSREDVDFFGHLEMHLRSEHPPLCGRDHMAYRSCYFPVKDVIDGDLCEQFATLPGDKQRAIAEELDRTPQEVLKKLEDLRAKIM